MNLNDQPKLGQMLEEVCAIYSKPYTDVLCGAYYRVLKPYSFEALSKAVLRILADENRRQLMPTAAEIKAIAQHLEVSDHEASYLRCQQPACQSLLAWPPSGKVTEASYYCPRHQPHFDPQWDEEKQVANRITPAEKREIFEDATPAARSFLRSIDAMAKQMRDIPVTPEEQAITDADSIPLRAKAFEEKAEGPGVNARVFLGNPMLTQGLTSEYADRRQIMASAGWRFDQQEQVWTTGTYVLKEGKRVWRKGNRKLRDEEIDSIPTQALLEDLVSRRSR